MSYKKQHVSKFNPTNLAATGLVALSLFASGQAAVAQDNVLFILDSSNSMIGQVGGVPKYKVAKQALTQFVDRMPSGVNMGLAAFGHRFDHKIKQCEDDMELFIGVGGLNPTEVRTIVDHAKPKGQTPIAQTLAQVPLWLEKHQGQNNTVVLVSDGVESCSGDPCAAAAALNEAGITTNIHVVGFDLTTEQRAKIQCIADNGNGKYFDAKDAAGFEAAMGKVQAEVVKAKPVIVAEAPKAKVEPRSQTTFEDQFKGEGLAKGWEVLNANDDRYVAEAGELLIIGAVPASDPAKAQMPNVMTHSAALPNGNWELEVQFRIEAQHGGEAFYFGVMNDHENWMSAGVRARMGYATVGMDAFIAKNEKGQVTRFDTTFGAADDTSSVGSTDRWKARGLGEKFGKKPFKLVLRKQGRAYSMSGTYADKKDKNFREFQTESLKMLGSKKKLFIAFGLETHGSYYQGEGNLMVDFVKVRKVGD